MLSKPTYQQTLALAAIFQSADQVYKLAYTGESDSDKTKFAMATLLNQNPDSIEQLYGAKQNLEEGFSIMNSFMQNASNSTEAKYKEIISYVMSAIHLASKLQKKLRIWKLSKNIHKRNISGGDFNCSKLVILTLAIEKSRQDIRLFSDFNAGK